MERGGKMSALPTLNFQLNLSRVIDIKYMVALPKFFITFTVVFLVQN